MLRFLAAVAAVLAVLTAGALIVAAVASRVAPLAAKLEARWARRTGAAGTDDRPDGPREARAGTPGCSRRCRGTIPRLTAAAMVPALSGMAGAPATAVRPEAATVADGRNSRC